MPEKSLYGSLKRLRDFPIDETSRFETYDQANYYCLNDRTAYIGQFLSIYNDNNKATGGEDKNGVYIIIESSTPGQKQLLRATDTDAIDRLTNGLAELTEDLGELEQKLGEDIETKLQSFATLEDLEEVNKKVEDLIGLQDGERIEETLDTVKEISDWIVSHENFVRTILDINERLNLINAQNEMLRSNLNQTSTVVSNLSRTVNNIVNANYITTADAQTLVRNSSYGYREISLSSLTYEMLGLPDQDLLIEKVNIFLETGSEDATFRVFIRNFLAQTDINYITNDPENQLTGEYDCAHIDLDRSGVYAFTLNAKLPKGQKLCYEINYGQNQPYGTYLEGTIGVFYYTLV